MASAKKKPESVPGVAEVMPGLPGPAEQIPGGVEPPLDAVKVAPGPTLDELEAQEHAEAMADKAAREHAEATKARPALVALRPAPAPATTTRRYRVWPHGDLQRDGVVYASGAELTLEPEIAATIPCLVAVE